MWMRRHLTLRIRIIGTIIATVLAARGAGALEPREIAEAVKPTGSVGALSQTSKESALKIGTRSTTTQARRVLIPLANKTDKVDPVSSHQRTTPKANKIQAQLDAT